MAQVPSSVDYQGRVSVGSIPFDGLGLFKFGLVNADGSLRYWLNSADANLDGEPDAAVSLMVSRGVFRVSLGDSQHLNMAPIPDVALNHASVFLRIWFNDGVRGFQRLTPDFRLSSVPYARVAGSVVLGGLGVDNLPAGTALVSNQAEDATLIGAGYQRFFSTLEAPWVAGATLNGLSARSGHAGVWTGSRFFVWGGQVSPGVLSAAGALYHPGLDVWESIPSAPVALDARFGHRMVWTGTRAVIWGGFSQEGFEASGARFDPAGPGWLGMNSTGALTGRDGLVGVWRSPYVVFWGGRNNAGSRNDGALYDPEADVWTALTTPNPPAARSGASAVVAGDRILIWGGSGNGVALDTGAQLLFQTEPTVQPLSWSAMSLANAPSARTDHTAVWTGSRMLIWGGRNGAVYLGDGASYDPVANAWTSLGGSGSPPSARAAHHAVWTGEEMVIFGGETLSGSTSTGAAYHPGTGKWRALTQAGTPAARQAGVSVWTGGEILVFGGISSGAPIAALQRLNPQPAWFFYRKP